MCGYLVNHVKCSFLFRKYYSEERWNPPCIAFLLKNESKTILVDTGPGAKSRAPQYYIAEEKREHLLADELARVGVDPAAIDTVILTHLHNDHVGGAYIFPNATFYVQEVELKEAVWPTIRFQRPYYDINLRGKRPSWTEILDRMEVLKGDADIVPAVSVVLLPGHTPGMQGVLVDTSDGKYLIASDLVPLFENWEPLGQNPLPNSNLYDLRDYYNSFDRMVAIGAKVLPGHDPKVFEYSEYPH
jgi:Zn-dependent hydrolases, including glyoxylases